VRIRRNAGVEDDLTLVVLGGELTALLYPRFMRFPTPLRRALLLTVLLPVAARAAEPPAPAATRAEALKEAEALLVSSQFAAAEAAYQRAAALPGGPCGECLLGTATVRASEGKWDEAADMTQRALPLLSDPALLARAYNQVGMAFVKQGGADGLGRAESALRNAVDYGTAWGDMARINLAQVLFLEQRWADAAGTAREALGKPGAPESQLRSARIVLCQARSHLPDELPELPGDAPPREVGSGIQRPERIAGPNPQYTAEARAAQTAGVVLLAGVIDREGCLRQAEVTQGAPNGLSEAALEAVRLWVYAPATEGGKPVAVKYTVSVKFTP
jgi:TonB family protein